MISRNTTKNLQQSLEEMRKIISEFNADMNLIKNPSNHINETLEFGVVDKFLFTKYKPDKNGFYGNLKLIQSRSDEFKILLEKIKSNKVNLSNNLVIMYKRVSNGWNYKLLKVFDKITSIRDAEKYLLLL